MAPGEGVLQPSKHPRRLADPSKRPLEPLKTASRRPLRANLATMTPRTTPGCPQDGRRTPPGRPQELPRTPSRPHLGAILASPTRRRPSKWPLEAAKIVSRRSEDLLGTVEGDINNVKQPQDCPNWLPRALTAQVGTSKIIVFHKVFVGFPHIRDLPT